VVRNYKRKRATPWRDKDKRMTLAVRMRAEGKSLRETAAELAVGKDTISRDLARWDAQQASAAPSNVISLSQKRSQSAVANGPAGGNLRHPDATENATPMTTGEALGLTVQQEAMARAIASMTDRRRV
jgi:hypothetical protein